ncbi:MAG: hypothetical protein ACOY30_01370 [Bacillota bacterium]
MSNTGLKNNNPGIEHAGHERAAGFVDWQQKYFDNLELQLKEIKDELRQNENRVSAHIREAMHKIYLLSNERHREYINVNERWDHLLARVDKKQDDQNKWVLRTAIALILGVASLVSTGIYSLYKFFDIFIRP